MSANGKCTSLGAAWWSWTVKGTIEFTLQIYNSKVPWRKRRTHKSFFSLSIAPYPATTIRMLPRPRNFVDTSAASCLYPLDCFMLRTRAGRGWRKVTSKYCVQTRPVNCSTVQYSTVQQSTVQNSTGQEAACLCAGCHDKSRAMLPWPECHGSCSTVGTGGTLDITWAQNARIPSVGTGLWWPPGKFGGPC